MKSKEIEQQTVSNPVIDEKSRKIIEERADRKDKPTYERLYEKGKEKISK